MASNNKGRLSTAELLDIGITRREYNTSIAASNQQRNPNPISNLNLGEYGNLAGLTKEQLIQMQENHIRDEERRLNRRAQSARQRAQSAQNKTKRTRQKATPPLADTLKKYGLVKREVPDIEFNNNNNTEMKQVKRESLLSSSAFHNNYNGTLIDCSGYGSEHQKDNLCAMHALNNLIKEYRDVRPFIHIKTLNNEEVDLYADTNNSYPKPNLYGIAKSTKKIAVQDDGFYSTDIFNKVLNKSKYTNNIFSYEEIDGHTGKGNAISSTNDLYKEHPILLQVFNNPALFGFILANGSHYYIIKKISGRKPLPDMFLLIDSLSINTELNATCIAGFQANVMAEIEHVLIEEHGYVGIVMIQPHIPDLHKRTPQPLIRTKTLVNPVYLGLMRHGERDDNDTQNIWDDKETRPFDCPILIHETQKLCKKSAKILRKFNFEFIITSPFRRCWQTAMIMADLLKITTIYIDENLVEDIDEIKRIRRKIKPYAILGNIKTKTSNGNNNKKTKKHSGSSVKHENDYGLLTDEELKNDIRIFAELMAEAYTFTIPQIIPNGAKLLSQRSLIGRTQAVVTDIQNGIGNRNGLIITHSGLISSISPTDDASSVYMVEPCGFVVVDRTLANSKNDIVTDITLDLITKTKPKPNTDRYYNLLDEQQLQPQLPQLPQRPKTARRRPASALRNAIAQNVAARRLTAQNVIAQNVPAQRPPTARNVPAQLPPSALLPSTRHATLQLPPLHNKSLTPLPPIAANKLPNKYIPTLLDRANCNDLVNVRKIDCIIHQRNIANHVEHQKEIIHLINGYEIAVLNDESVNYPYRTIFRGKTGTMSNILTSYFFTLYEHGLIKDVVVNPVTDLKIILCLLFTINFENMKTNSNDDFIALCNIIYYLNTLLKDKKIALDSIIGTPEQHTEYIDISLNTNPKYIQMDISQKQNLLDKNPLYVICSKDDSEFVPYEYKPDYAIGLQPLTMDFKNPRRNIETHIKHVVTFIYNCIR